MYTVPDKYKIRLHHVRPRFKNDIENVLIFIATEISKLSPMPSKDFATAVNSAIMRYPGNSESTPKTIDNWRTEISALFGFIEHNEDTDKCGNRAKELAENGDLIECFKTFLFNFQYPGSHLTTKSIAELTESGVHFKPAQYILKLLKYAEEKTGKRAYITKPELCHCMFNDLRVVRDNQDVSDIWKRIEDNRANKIQYDTNGDVIRYAGDIADYMVIANFLVTYDTKRYYINNLEELAVKSFIESSEWFDGYDTLIKDRSGDYNKIKLQYDKWFKYVNRDLGDTDFKTDINTFLATDTETEETAVSESQKSFMDLLSDNRAISTKDIGDFGESLVFSHECERLRREEREDLVHLIARIPTQLAVGYDIKSMEADDRQRFIEVKTTISSKPLQFFRVHLTPNEWRAAETNKDRYFIYRLMLSKTEQKLYVVQDPVGLYKRDSISMVPTDGADLILNQNSGKEEEIIAWKN